MAYNHEYPYVDPNRYNADWILHKIKELDGEMDDFTALNKITFDGAWNITKQYPAWTIVNVGGTTGYISIKPVPSGVNYTNTDYWQLIVDYTITLADLQNRVVALEARVDTLEADPQKYVFIGDSYGETYGPVTGWVDQIISKLGLAPAQYQRYAVSGTGFAAANGAWLNAVNAMTADDTITEVVFVGGSNDVPYVGSAYAADYLKDAIENTIAAARVKFPKARISVGFCCHAVTATNDPEIINIRKGRNVYEQSAAAVGCAIIKDMSPILYDHALMYNTSHPNTDGCDKISDAIISHLKGGTFDAGMIETDLVATFDAATSANYIADFVKSIDGYTLHLRMKPTTNEGYSAFTFASPGVSVNTNGSTSIALCKLAGLPLSGRGDGILLGSACAMVGTQNHSWLPMNVRLNYWQGYITANFLYAGTNGSFTDNITAVWLPAGFGFDVDVQATGA